MVTRQNRRLAWVAPISKPCLLRYEPWCDPGVAAEEADRFIDLLLERELVPTRATIARLEYASSRLAYASAL
jgi:hypothetical protein